MKNLPKHLKEKDLAQHFSQKGGQVTDAKIMFQNERSRKFGFVGFKNDEMAKEAKEYFNKTFLHTSRIEVEFAKAQNDETLPRPWSKHSTGSSANTRDLKAKGKLDMKQKRGVGSANSAEVEAKKNRFREFLKVAGTGAGTQKEAQSWNDQFTDFMMARPEERKKSNKNKEGEESKGP